MFTETYKQTINSRAFLDTEEVGSSSLLEPTITPIFTVKLNQQIHSECGANQLRDRQKALSFQPFFATVLRELHPRPSFTSSRILKGRSLHSAP